MGSHDPASASRVPATATLPPPTRDVPMSEFGIPSVRHGDPVAIHTRTSPDWLLKTSTKPGKVRGQDASSTIYPPTRIAEHPPDRPSQARSASTHYAMPASLRRVAGGLGSRNFRGEKVTVRGQIFDDLQAHSGSMGQESAETWTAQTLLQPGRLLLPKLPGKLETGTTAPPHAPSHP